MSPIVSPITNPLAMYSALVIEFDLADVLASASTLAAASFHVTVAETFHDAKRRLSMDPPSLLIAGIRLGEHNGLHLVLRGKAARPGMGAIVTSHFEDLVLRADAEQMGAAFVLLPTTAAELRAAAFRAVFAGPYAVPGEPLRPPFERRGAERRTESVPRLPERRHVDRRTDPALLMRMTRTIG